MQDKMHIVHCGVDPDKFTPVSQKSLNKVPIILFVAQLTEKKGTPFLVKACKILKDNCLDFRCTIVGDGPQKPLIKELIKSNKLEDNVQLAGRVFQEELKSYLADADIFVLPCIQKDDGEMDGIPVVLMEAMAMQLPVVSTPISGIPELINDGQNGLLVEQKNPQALAEALQQLCLDTKLRKKLGQKGREKVIKDFNINKTARKLKTLFESCINPDD
jgi:glycosyltransferase involved in cell wall biosynthesis